MGEISPVLTFNCYKNTLNVILIAWILMNQNPWKWKYLMWICGRYYKGKKCEQFVWAEKNYQSNNTPEFKTFPHVKVLEH